MITYVKLDGFYVETQRRGLRHRGPIGVQRGNILVDASGAAELCGVRRGMSPGAAKRICPNLKILSFGNYRSSSEEVRAKLVSLTPFVEGLDFHETFISSTGLSGNGLWEALKALMPHFGHRLVASSASNKFAARLGGSIPAEGGGVITRRVDVGKERQFVAPFPVDAIDAPGEIKESLKRLGVSFIGELFSFSREDLKGMYGVWAGAIDRSRNGQGDEIVKPYTMFPWVREGDTDGRQPQRLVLDLRRDLEGFCRDVERAGMGIGFISLKVWGPNISCTRRKTFIQRVSQVTVVMEAIALLFKRVEPTGEITSFRLEAGDLGPAGISQGDLFEEATTEIETVVDALKRRYGHSIIERGHEICRRERMLQIWDPLRSGRDGSLGAGKGKGGV